MSKSLVIVESPTKARTIERFLGKDYDVKASYGHVRDLPDSASEIPPEIKKQKWSRLGINVDDNFEPLYIIPPGKEKHVKELRKSLKGAKEILLATDEDREGESISWHLIEVLKPKVPYKRMVFHEITKDAIAAALKTPRELDENLVRAQETRRIVDRLFGYSVSPLLWKKVAPRLSAGRVQSVAMRLLVERERERLRFHAGEYWDLTGVFSKQGGSGESFEAQIIQLAGKRIASGKDFDPETGKVENQSKIMVLCEAEAKALAERLSGLEARVASVEEKPYISKPPAPFVTSTLQQEGSRKLNFGAKYTMSIAQRLYEHGLITYMRTDSTTLSEEGLKGARAVIARDFGKEFLPPHAREYKTRVKNAQEAHEAIRPAGLDFAAPESIRHKLGADAFKLYDLIWKRTVASQMKDATGMRVSVDLECADALFRANGKTIEFSGFLRAYVEGSDDPEGDLAERERILPKLAVGEKVKAEKMTEFKHVTQPPARYTEGSLIKELERRGIGRPSTWATIVDVVLSRTYAFKRGGTLIPTFLAMVLTNLMERYFTSLMDYEFTAHLEDDLDSISRGEAQNLDYLRTFYFGNGFAGLKRLVTEGEEKIDPREVCGLPIGQDDQGKAIEVRIGRYGPFLTDGEQRASTPEDTAPDEMNPQLARKLLDDAARGPASLGEDPATGLSVYVKSGRFGPYVQLGEQDNNGGAKPKMVSLLAGMTPSEMNLETALRLLELPKNLGVNPETQEAVVVALGRFGPYIKSGTETRSVPADQGSPLDLTLEKALEILKLPKGQRRATSQPKTLKDLGVHPESKASVSLKAGRYGPYVTDGELNASLPRDMDLEAVTLDVAVSLLAQRAAAGGEKKKKKTRTTRKKKAK